MTIRINGQDVEIRPGDTILAAARRAGQFIPSLCELAPLGHAPGTCRVCLIEIEAPDGSDPAIVTACDTPAKDGMTIRTRNARLRQMQRLQVELLLAEHDQDCATCARHGDCEIQDVARHVGLDRPSLDFSGWAKRQVPDRSSPAMSRDMGKCIRCLRCVAVCRDVQGIGAMVMSGKGEDAGIGLRGGVPQAASSCVACGQCVLVCPTGALAEQDDTDRVEDLLDDPDIVTVFQFAPAVRVGFAERVGLANVEGQVIAALRAMGADIVLDTNFAADLVIMEEGNEVLANLRNGRRPTFTSCCPGWVNFAETHIPAILPFVSSTRSPQQCLGSLAKTYLAEKMAIAPERMRVISIMPCTAKKEERARPEFAAHGRADVDVVLTIREFESLLTRRGVALGSLAPSSFDNPFMTDYSGAGAIFGTSGGVMEAALRTLYFVLNGHELDGIELAPLRGFEQVRSARIEVGGALGSVNVAICHGLKGARQVAEAVLAGTADFDFVEVMACPGGCADGGGHLRRKKAFGPDLAKREALFAIDRGRAVRQSHHNAQVRRLYDDFLGQPLSETAHHLLHTHYRDRR